MSHSSKCEKSVRPLFLSMTITCDRWLVLLRHLFLFRRLASGCFLPGGCLFRSFLLCYRLFRRFPGSFFLRCRLPGGPFLCHFFLARRLCPFRCLFLLAGLALALELFPHFSERFVDSQGVRQVLACALEIIHHGDRK